MTTKLQSFAKINLGLEVLGTRPDGYHEIRTIFQTIDLCDTITLKENQTGVISVSGTDATIDWGGKNTVSQAFRQLYGNFHLRQGYDVRIVKNIPPGSGLGGGSGNAAVILLFLCEHFQLRISLTDLLELARGIGADVPFFLFGGTAIGEGIGERITLIPEITSQRLALIVPRMAVSTRFVFSHCPLTNAPFASKIDSFTRTGDFSILENKLEDVTLRFFPEIGKIKEQLRTLGLNTAWMSGSGSAVFALLGRKRTMKLKRAFPDLRICRTINRATYHHHIGVWPNGKASAFGAEIRRFESSHPREHT